MASHRLFSLFLCFGMYVSAPGQTSPLGASNDTLVELHHQLFKEKDDKVKAELNTRFLSTFERALHQDKSFEFAFDSLKEVARLTSPDKKFRIINWNIAKSNGTYEYYGFIQSFNPKTKKYDLHILADKTADIKSPENMVTTPSRWYGMLYYKIIEKKHRRNTTYLLLGWKGRDKLTSQKIIEGMNLDGKGIPKFGTTSLEVESKKSNRVIFEYAAELTMSLKYNDKMDMIIFDHLSPKESSLMGQYQFYGPDMSHDGLLFKKGKWLYVKDVDARNGNDPKDKFYNKEPKKEKEKDMYKPR